MRKALAGLALLAACGGGQEPDTGLPDGTYTWEGGRVTVADDEVTVRGAGYWPSGTFPLRESVGGGWEWRFPGGSVVRVWGEAPDWNCLISGRTAFGEPVSEPCVFRPA